MSVSGNSRVCPVLFFDISCKQRLRGVFICCASGGRLHGAFRVDFTIKFRPNAARS